MRDLKTTARMIDDSGPRGSSSLTWAVECAIDVRRRALLLESRKKLLALVTVNSRTMDSKFDFLSAAFGVAGM